MTRSYALTAAASVAVFSSINAWAADPLPTETHKVLTLALAVEAAQGAIASCKGQGYNVSVSIVDRTGVPQVLLAGDGASVNSRDLARRKAYSPPSGGSRPGISPKGSPHRARSIPPSTTLNS